MTLDQEPVLVINPGSSSLKWGCFRTTASTQPILSDSVELNEIESSFENIAKKFNISLVVIRYVHGGPQYHSPLLITDDLLESLPMLDEYAPMHNPLSRWCVDKAKLWFKSSVRIVAVFDTEYFHDLPKVSQAYSLPRALVKKYGIRRYGFHGFAHDGMYQYLFSRKKEFNVNLNRTITIQLGSGCSMAAIKNGFPIDTTMGFTPNEGLLMATRSGDIDSGLLTWLQAKEGWDHKLTENVLNKESGWYGISGLNTDMQLLLQDQEPASRLAVELFIWRIRKALGAYFAILGGLDSIIISGGIAENNPQFCQILLTKLIHLGIEVDDNSKVTSDSPIELSSQLSTVKCWVVANQEFQSMLASTKRGLQEIYQQRT